MNDVSMSLRQLSIQWKITLLAGLCLLGIVTLLVGLSLYRMEHSSELVKASSMQMLTEAAQARIESQGEVQALGIRQQFMDAYQYGNGFSARCCSLREQAEKRFLDAFDTREDLTRQVKAALQANPTCSACPWCSKPTRWTARTNCSPARPSWAATTRAASPCTGRSRRQAN
jgi:methyl-accepting chemotaxis protein